MNSLFVLVLIIGITLILPFHVLSIQPVVYEISTRPWFYELFKKHGKKISLRDNEGFDIVKSELLELKNQYPMDYVWMMGVWKLGRYGLEHDYNLNFDKVLPGYTRDDVIGSPYAVVNYTCNPEIGTDEDLLKLRSFLNKNGMKLMLDFVPNHVAVDHPWTCSHPEYLIPVDETLVGDSNSCMEGDFSVVPPCQKKTGKKFFYGGDYWNSGWTDTLQLNYWNPHLRKAQIKNMLHIASLSDGVRIDMAMSVFNKQIELSWVKDRKSNSCSTGKRGVIPRKFVKNPPRKEFWEEALKTIQQKYPKYIFMAEAYNYGFTKPAAEDMTLRQLGFHFTYDIVSLKFLHKSHQDFFRYVSGQGKRFFKNSVQFVENHDDNRAAGKVLGNAEKAMIGAVATSFLPGLKLFNHGQFQCLTHKLGVHLRRSADEHVNTHCENYFKDMIPLLQDDIMKKGNWLGISGMYASSENNPYHRNWDVISWKWKFGNQMRLVVINFRNEWSEGRILLGEIGDIQSSKTISIRERVDLKRTFELDAIELRDAGLNVILGPLKAQIYDYQV